MAVELITVKEAAKRLGVSARTVYRAKKAGKYKLSAPNVREYLLWDDGKLVLAENNNNKKSWE